MRRERRISMAKVVILGDSGVGKTSIVLQFAHKTFSHDTDPTVGGSYVTKEVKTTHGPFTLHIWDTAGQERYKSVVPMYLRGCRAALIVFSQDNRDSLENLRTWIALLKEIQKEEILIGIVGNKTDLGENSPVIEDGKLYAQAQGYEFFETTATDGATIRPVFEWVAEHLAALSEATMQEEKRADFEVQEGTGCC